MRQRHSAAIELRLHGSSRLAWPDNGRWIALISASETGHLRSHVFGALPGTRIRKTAIDALPSGVIHDGIAPMLPTERLPYSAISQRKPLVLPDGARLAVWVIVNVEEWDINETMPRPVLTPPAGGSPMPDIPNWAWHEYGNRGGFLRMLDVFDDLRIPAVLAINRSAICP